MSSDDTPKSPRPRRNHRVPLRAVIGFTELLRARGLTEAFVEAVKEAEATVTLSEKTATFVRAFLDAHEEKPTRSATTAAKTVAPGRADAMAPWCDDPWECPIR